MGKPGRWIISQLLRDFKAEKQIDYTICNVENAAGGFGVTREMSKKMFSYGIDMQTSGNHIWDREEIREYLNGGPKLLRPANFPSGAPGSGLYIDKLQRWADDCDDQPAGASLHEGYRLSVQDGRW